MLIASHQDHSKKSAKIWFYVQKSKHFDSPFLFRIFWTSATHSIPFSAFPLPLYTLHCTEPLYPGHSYPNSKNLSLPIPGCSTLTPTPFHFCSKLLLLECKVKYKKPCIVLNKSHPSCSPSCPPCAKAISPLKEPLDHSAHSLKLCS
jgi:hypothetical protein